MITISVAAQKGGVGKTSTSITLAAYLARKGYKTLLIDVDPQGNSTQVVLDNYQILKKEDTVASILLERDELATVAASRIPNLYVCPSHDELSIAESLLSSLHAKERRLAIQLEPIKEKFDFVIIDCPPNVNDLPQNAMVASDYIIIPFQADSFNLRGLQLLLDQKKKLNKYFNPQLEVLGLLSVAYDQRAKISSQVYELLVKQFGLFSKGGKVFETKIPINNSITYANSAKKDIFEFEPTSKIARAYTTLIEKEILPYLLSNK